jgi:hypothetical protein
MASRVKYGLHHYFGYRAVKGRSNWLIHEVDFGGVDVVVVVVLDSFLVVVCGV